MSAVLALFTRALRQDARRPSTYWTRGLLIFVISLFAGRAGVTGWAGAPGLALFEWLAWTNVLFISIGSLGYFCSAIAEEKEEGMLGLLRMTNLSALSILLGKSTSRLAGGLLLLLAQIPFTLLAITFGGIGLRQIGAAYLFLGAWLFFVANLALLMSVIVRRAALAAVGAGALQIVLVIAPGLSFPAGSRMLNALDPSFGQRALLAWLEFGHHASPLATLPSILGAGFAGPLLGAPVPANLVAGVVCFAASWMLFDFCCDRLERSGPEDAIPRLEPLRRFQARRAWKQALAWKDFYFVSGGVRTSGVILALTLSIFALLRYEMNPAWTSPGLEEFGMLLIAAAVLAWMVEATLIAGRFLRVEQHGRTLSGLAMLPHGIPHLVLSKALGCFMAGWPIACLGLAGIACYLAGESPKQPAMAIMPFTGPDGPFSHGLAAVAHFLFFLHFTAWLSLRIRYGAVAISIAICGFLAFCLEALGPGGSALMIGYAVPFSLLLQTRIVVRLKQLAAEEA